MTTAVPSTRNSSPTTTSLSDGITQRTATVRSRSTMETGTAVSPAFVTHSVATSSVVA